MMTHERASFIAYDWIDAWNRRDLDRVLAHYDRRIQHTTPMAVKFSKASDYTIRGKKRLKEYFEAGLRMFKNTQFALKDIFVGADSMSIVYETIGKQIAVETMLFNEKGRVVRSFVSYR